MNHGHPLLLRRLALAALMLGLQACGGKVVLSVCEPGTKEVNGECVPIDVVDEEPTCPSGTKKVGDACVPLILPLEPCLIGGNVAYLNGEPGDFVHEGEETIKVGSWFNAAWSTSIFVDVTTPAAPDGISWSFQFNTDQLGQPLEVKAYEDAERAAFASPGHPGLEVSGNGKGCNILTGRFEIHELNAADGTLVNLSASFEQHCEGLAPALRGCVHVEQ